MAACPTPQEPREDMGTREESGKSGAVLVMEPPCMGPPLEFLKIWRLN